MAKVLIDGSHDSAATPAAVPTCSERKHAVTTAAYLPSARSEAVVLNPSELERALAASRLQLNAARSRIDALETECSLYRRQVALLDYAVAQAREFAYHDELTGLPNRRLLLDRYNQAVALAARQHRQVALLFLDLDGFKGINDTHGHATGDRVLQQVAMRLRACIRTSDTACRYGGDEFVVLLPELDRRQSPVAAARKIRARLAVPYIVDDTAITVTASIGMAVYPVDGHAYDELMHATDNSMYRDKARNTAGDSTPSAAPSADSTPNSN